VLPHTTERVIMKVLSLFDGKYDVTQSGDVFSNVGKRKKMVGKTTAHGYHMVVLTVSGKKLYKVVHRLVAKAFIPNPDELPEVNHKDGNKLNNHYLNLEWCNSSYNQIHARDNGLQRYKLNMDTANKIRALYKEGKHSQTSLGAMFGIKKTQVGYIIHNKRWSI